MKIFEKKLIEKFKNRNSFTRNELFDFFREFEPDLNEGTFGWRIHALKQNSIIKPLRRGIYTVAHKQSYEPAITADIKNISKKLANRYKDIKYCVWSTGWLNTFSQHQTVKKTFIIDIEKEFIESVFYFLKDSLKYEIFLNPDNNTMNYYISESHAPVIIKGLITRSPVNVIKVRNQKIPVPMLEKILVDVFVDPKLFYYYQGSEMRHIFRNAMAYYSINYTTLLSYANRRGRGNEIKSFIINNVDIAVKDIIDG